MKKQKRNEINQHNFSYDKAREHALRAIYEGVIVKVDGQTFEYDKQHDELWVIDFYGASVYRPKLNGLFCNPFAEIIWRYVE